MIVEKIQHVGICVTDLDEALAFYCGVMGFTLDSHRPDFGIPGCWLNTGSNQLHLIELTDDTPGQARHLAFQIDDLDAWSTHLRTHGVEVRPLRYFAGAGRQVFLSDPSGNTIELNEPDR